MVNSVISAENKRRLHVWSEAAAVFLVAPWAIWVSQKVDNPHKSIAILVAILTILIDGVLLLDFLS